jgi:hypothetical protein
MEITTMKQPAAPSKSPAKVALAKKRKAVAMKRRPSSVSLLAMKAAARRASSSSVQHRRHPDDFGVVQSGASAQVVSWPKL